MKYRRANNALAMKTVQATSAGIMVARIAAWEVVETTSQAAMPHKMEHCGSAAHSASSMLPTI